MALTYVPAGRSGYLKKPNRSQRFQLSPQSKDPIGSSDLKAEALALFRFLQVGPRGCRYATSVTFRYMISHQWTPCKRTSLFRVSVTPCTRDRGADLGRGHRHGVVARRGAGITGASATAAPAACQHTASEGHKERQHSERGLPATPLHRGCPRAGCKLRSATGGVPPASRAYGIVQGHTGCRSGGEEGVVSPLPGVHGRAVEALRDRKSVV